MAIKLTKDYDSVTGTEANDTFTAKVLGNSNTFQSGDEINGGAGTDTLNIVLGQESQFAISAETTGVEVVSVRSQSTHTINNGNSGDNNVSNNTLGSSATTDNTIDAQDMVGVKKFENTDSRADLVIEDVRIGGIAGATKNAKGQITTENVTIAWKNTDPASMDDKVDYEVYFSPESLRKSDGTSTISLQWMDTRAATDGVDKTDMLENLNFQGFKLKIDGVEKEISSDAINAATGYSDLISALNAYFSENKLSLSATAGTKFKATDTKNVDSDGHALYSSEGVNVVIGSTAGSSLQFVELVTKGAVPTDSGAHSNPITVNTPGFITSKVVLDNVGRESESGDLVIGSMSTRSGVEKFKVDVLHTEGKNVETMGNWVSSMSSTNEKLQEVVITKNDGAYLYVGSQDKDSSGIIDSVGRNLTTDRETVSASTFVNTDGLTDVRVFDASKMTGNVKVGAKLANTDGADGAADTSKKYLLKDSSSTVLADKAHNAYYDADDTDNIDAGSDGYVEGDRYVDFKYDTGSGSDTVNLEINDQADLFINTRSGDDSVKLNVTEVLGGQVNIRLGSGTNTLILDKESATGWSADSIIIAETFTKNTVSNFDLTHDKFNFVTYNVSKNYFGAIDSKKDGSISVAALTADDKTTKGNETTAALEKTYTADVATATTEDHIVINSNDGAVYYAVDGVVSLVGTISLVGIDLTKLTGDNFA